MQAGTEGVVTTNKAWMLKGDLKEGTWKWRCEQEGGDCIKTSGQAS